MKIGVVKEIVGYEKRVALIPDALEKIVKAGYEALVQSGAGDGAMIRDGAYEDVGARIASGPQEVFSQADVVPKVQRPVHNEMEGKHEVEMMREGLILISLLQPHEDPGLIKRLIEKKITAFSMSLIPRISRAQSMDVLSSQATVAGYKAVLIGSASLGKFFPMLTTAAGTLAPAKVLVLGAGVAGLMAIATAKRLGAVVEAFDIRPAVKEEVESLGAKFIDIELEAGETQDEKGYAKEISQAAKEREQAVITEHVKNADVVITTAAVPGKKAPLLITEDMVKGMKPGSVIVDIAAATGGNCELSEPGKEVVKHGVVIHGPLNLASTIPLHASQMYSRNITNFLAQIIHENKLDLNLEDEVVRETCVTHDGKVLNRLAAEQVK
ncbi:MAG: Re/Si-specific NAD(P)(+) transhydrogenase subunit alpha [Candidatus Glassbacteria bacterium]